MFKKSLTEGQMSDAAYIDQAVTWSKDLTRMKTRGPGDLDNAMRQVAREYDVDYWTLWQLRYRRSRVRDIGVSVYMRLKHAWEAEREHQLRQLQHDIEITKAKAGASHPAVVAAEALVGEERARGGAA